jgi:methyl-accepting chemotaxis protein
VFDRVNTGYTEITNEIKGLSKVEQVLLDTADSVMDTKRKIEFGVQQIVFKIGELVKMSGGKVDERLEDQFKDITQTILENQNEALGNLTTKVEKEIGQVWRQMGIMYSKVSNSIDILEKVKSQTENYVNNTGKNLGTMEGQVEGLTDRVADVDTSLNYMVGQLSLVVQEFNQVKTNLADGISQLGGELDEIREYKPSNNPNESNNQEDK